MALFKTNSEKNNKLAKIMSICFDEPLSSVNFFLENKPPKSKCYTCTQGNNIISVLHSLFYKIKLKENYFKCSYIYGACTAPKYRKKGYMSKLIKYCEIQSKLDGFDFSILVPDNEHLKNYYYKFGYKNFFKTKNISLKKDQILDICRLSKAISSKTEDKNIYKNIENLRLNIYNNIDHILYSEEDIKYAVNLYKFFSGNIISLQEGYGICVPINEKTLEIKDFTCKNEFIPNLLQKIYINFPNYENFEIKTSSTNNFFKENVKTHFFGMIKPLSQAAKETISSFEHTNDPGAYLGLALD